MKQAQSFEIIAHISAAINITCLSLAARMRGREDELRVMTLFLVYGHQVRI